MFDYTLTAVGLENAAFQRGVKTRLHKTVGTVLGPVVQRPISANPGFKLEVGFLLVCSKVFPRIIVSILFRASNHQDKGITDTKFAF